MTQITSANNVGAGFSLHGVGGQLAVNKTKTQDTSSSGFAMGVAGGVISTLQTSIGDADSSFGIYGSGNTILGSTVLNSAGGSFNFEADHSTIVNTTGGNLLDGIWMSNQTGPTINSTNNALYDIAYPDGTPNNPIQVYGSSNITVGGALLTKPSPTCVVGTGAGGVSDSAVQVNSSCDYGPGETLTPTTYTVSANQLFVGQVASDGTNSNGSSIPLGFASITDWFNFDNFYRGWGVNSGTFPNSGDQARCASGDSCTIYDASLLASSSVIRGYFGTYVSGVACPASVNASVAANVITDEAGNVFLRNAVEAVGDLIRNPRGNQNGLCESDEACIFMPNFGSYQGHGTLGSPCTFTGGNGVTGVTIYGYGTNGY